MRVSFPPPLGQFLGGYFNQDWYLDHPTWQAVVNRYLAREPVKVIAAAADELKAVLASERDEGQLEHRLLREYGCYFAPAAVGLTAREWLSEVLKMLAAHHAGGAA